MNLSPLGGRVDRSKRRAISPVTTRVVIEEPRAYLSRRTYLPANSESRVVCFKSIRYAPRLRESTYSESREFQELV